MNATRVLLVMALREAWRGRWLAALLIGLAGCGELLIRFSGGGPTTFVSLLDVAIILTPLAGLVVGTMQVHHGRELTELLLAQPTSRRQLFLAQYLGAAIPLMLALVLGLLAPFAWHGLLWQTGGGQLLALAAVVGLLTLISVALAFVIALTVDDRVRALGVALGIWLVATVLWDGLILLVAMMFGNGPVEGPLVAMLAVNPFDLARVLLLLGSDASAMLGYTGAVVEELIGSDYGRVALIAALMAWALLPIGLARRTFTRKDF